MYVTLIQTMSLSSFPTKVRDAEDDFLLLNLTPAGRGRGPCDVHVPTSIELPSLTTTPLSPTSLGCAIGDDDVYSPPPAPPPVVDTFQRARVNGIPGYVRAATPADDGSDLECALLTDVLGEVRYLTGRMRHEADTQKVCSDWKFAAMVIDRLCLWLFSIFTVVSSGTILLSAPDVINIF